MNEGLNPHVLEPTQESFMDQDHGWLEETKAMVNRGLRHFERSRPEMHQSMSLRQQINAAVHEARGKKRKDTNGR